MASVLAIGLMACAAPGPAPAPACDARSSSMVVDTLYFGTDRGAGVPVSQAQWQAFIDSVVTPRFPAGLTHWRANGQWRNARGEILRETSFVLMIAHDGTREGEAALHQVEASWRSLYQQESVMRVRSRACVSF